MPDPTSTWTWHLTPNHWIDLSLGEMGLTYGGTDWDCQSGGGYMAGFQTLREFAEQGPINEMPPDVEAAVRAAIQGLTGLHRVVIRVAGEEPDEIHMTFRGQPQIKHNTSVVFDGDLAPGTYTTSGIVIFSGADAKGRRRMLTFEEAIDVDGPMTVEIDDLQPRFDDRPAESDDPT